MIIIKFTINVEREILLIQLTGLDQSYVKISWMFNRYFCLNLSIHYYLKTFSIQSLQKSQFKQPIIYKHKINIYFLLCSFYLIHQNIIKNKTNPSILLKRRQQICVARKTNNLCFPITQNSFDIQSYFYRQKKEFR